jgi:hypothetical protein
MAASRFMRAILALLPEFLAQREKEIHESREAHIRVKSLGTAQQMLICRVTVLKALQRDPSAQQAASAADLTNLGKRQSQIESDRSTVEGMLSALQRENRFLGGRASLWPVM